MKYQVHKTITGKVVSYACPHCRASLKSKLQEAGSEDACPECGGKFIVPGKREKITEELQQRKKQEEKQQRHLRKVQEHKARHKPTPPPLPVAQLDEGPEALAGLSPAGRTGRVRRSGYTAAEPQYLALRVLAVTFLVIGVVTILVGLLVLFKVLMTPVPDWRVKMVACAAPVGIIVSGIGGLALAAILETMRDLALNSWHIRRQTGPAR